MSLRPASAGDAPALAVFLRRTFVEAYAHVADARNLARFLDETYAESTIAAELRRTTLDTFIDDGDEGLRGVIQLDREARAPVALPGAPAFLVRRLYVDAPWQGRGVAATLLHHVLDRARAEGAAGLWLSAYQRAPQALRFYEKHGFEVAGTTFFEVGAVRTDDFVLYRAL